MRDNLFEKIFDSLESQNINVEEFRHLSGALPPIRGIHYGPAAEPPPGVPSEILTSFQNIKQRLELSDQPNAS